MRRWIIGGPSGEISSQHMYYVYDLHAYVHYPLLNHFRTLDIGNAKDTFDPPQQRDECAYQTCTHRVHRHTHTYIYICIALRTAYRRTGPLLYYWGISDCRCFPIFKWETRPYWWGLIVASTTNFDKQKSQETTLFNLEPKQRQPWPKR